MTKEATRLKMLDIHSPAEEVLAALINERFARQWIFETKSAWKDRTFAVALWETTGHTLALISGHAQLYLDRDMTEKFPGYSREQVEKILTQSQLLFDFFRQTIAT